MRGEQYEYLYGSRSVRQRRAVRLCCFKLLSSKDAKKAYTHATAAALRVKESVMETVTSVQENAADILASAKEINEQRAKAEEAASVECSEA